MTPVMNRFQRRVRERLVEAERASALHVAHRAASREEHKRHLSRIMSDLRRLFDDAVAVGAGALWQPDFDTPPQRLSLTGHRSPVIFALACGLGQVRGLRVTCDLATLRLEREWLLDGEPLGPAEVIPPGGFTAVDVEEWIDQLLAAQWWLKGASPSQAGSGLVEVGREFSPPAGGFPATQLGYRVHCRLPASTLGWTAAGERPFGYQERERRP